MYKVRRGNRLRLIARRTEYDTLEELSIKHPGCWLCYHVDCELGYMFTICLRAATICLKAGYTVVVYKKLEFDWSRE